jgi:starch synthase
MATGFTFTDPSPEALAANIRRAIEVYALPERWNTLQRNGMAQTFSWDRSAQQYIALYHQLAASRQPSSY